MFKLLHLLRESSSQPTIKLVISLMTRSFTSHVTRRPNQPSMTGVHFHKQLMGDIMFFRGQFYEIVFIVAAAHAAGDNVVFFHITVYFAVSGSFYESVIMICVIHRPDYILSRI